MKVEEEDEGDRKKENAKSSVSTKRSRAAAIHNQSERVSFFLFIFFLLSLYLCFAVSHIIIIDGKLLLYGFSLLFVYRKGEIRLTKG